eukprot:scaffold234000_cov23-Prasinocladus_malaysianus.AAC.1
MAETATTSGNRSRTVASSRQVSYGTGDELHRCPSRGIVSGRYDAPIAGHVGSLLSLLSLSTSYAHLAKMKT